MRVVDSSGFVFGELDSLPGCSSVVVSHAVFAAPMGKGRGLGSKAHAERLAYMRSLGWEYALCTVDSENKPQIAILKKFGWKQLDGFENDKTGHFVTIYGKHLYEEDVIATRGSTILENK